MAEARKNGINIKYSDDLDSGLKPINIRINFGQIQSSFMGFSIAYSSCTYFKDGHHYIHPDTKQNRSITVRRSSLDYRDFQIITIFLDSRTSALTQIGNAVPPIFSKKMADADFSIGI